MGVVRKAASRHKRRVNGRYAEQLYVGFRYNMCTAECTLGFPKVPTTQGDRTMKTMAKLLVWTVTAVTLAATVPTEAQVSVGVGVGGPGPGNGYHRHWCYNHPGACGNGGYAYAGAPVVGVPVVGVYVAGRGYWGGHGWYGHRYWDRGGWRYR
jgi:hypothetical protein